MVNPVSNLNYCSKVYFRANDDLINSEGKFTDTSSVQEDGGDKIDLSTKSEEPKKKNGLWKALAWTAAALALVIGGSFAVKKNCSSFNLPDASWYKKAIVKPAEWCESGWKQLAGLFGKKSAEVAEAVDVAEVTEVAS